MKLRSSLLLAGCALLLVLAAPTEARRRRRPRPVCPYPDLNTADADGNGIMDFVDAACPCSDDSSPDRVYTEDEREDYIDCVKDTAKDAFEKNCLGDDKDAWKDQKRAAKDSECYTPYEDEDEDDNDDKDDHDNDDKDDHDNDDDRRRMRVRRLLRALRSATSSV